MTERLHFHFSLSCIGEGNGNPLQCSCLENPRDGVAWWAAVYGVAQSRTRLKRLSRSGSKLTQHLGMVDVIWSKKFFFPKEKQKLYNLSKTTKVKSVFESRPIYSEGHGISLPHPQLLLRGTHHCGFPGGSVVKNPPASLGDTGSIPGSGRSPGEGSGNPLQYSCLENPMKRGA